MNSSISISIQKKIDSIVISVAKGEVITFGEIAEKIWGKKNCASLVGRYIFLQREREDYPWWRVVNACRGRYHPVANAFAIKMLEVEGHVLQNGRF
ncbi:MAG: MGMT family protein [Lachnospiraceae bacterium]|nr:MGMT family protein [Lachnospiraceae bacterium]